MSSLDAVWLAALLVVLLTVIVVAKSIRVIPTFRAGVVERAGRYHRTLAPGVRCVVPWVDDVRYVVDLREQVITFPRQPVSTADERTVWVEAVVAYQVGDPVAACYEIPNYLAGMEQVVVSALRGVVSDLDAEESINSRGGVGESVQKVAAEVVGAWGVHVTRVEIINISTDAGDVAPLEGK